MKMANNVEVIVTEGTAQWAKVLPHQMVTNDQYADYNYWSIDVTVSDEERKRLEKMNIKGTEKDPNTFKMKLKEYTAKGKQNDAPTIVDSAKRVWENGEIGNGSKVKVSFYVYDHQASKRYGLGKRLKAIQVLEHVPYTGGGSGLSEFESEEAAEQAKDF